jgi:hypothetical protein
MTAETLLSLSKRVAREKSITTELEATKLAQSRSKVRQDILSDLKGIGKSGSLESIVAAERIIVETELRDYANSKSMESSLKDALEELDAIETHIGLVGDLQKYQQVDASNAQHKLRDGRDLPKDGARHAFRSHDTRLGNYNKARSDNHEKSIIQARQQNIRTAEKLYIGRQEKALDRKPGE